MTEVYATERLRIRRWTDDDADLDRIYDMYSRWEVMRYLGAQPRVMASRDESPAAVKRWRELSDEDPRFGCWAIEVRETGKRETGKRETGKRETGKVAGTVLFKLLPNSDGTPSTDVEVGWHLHPDSHGHGYATEAARGAVERGFAAGIPVVFAVVYPQNTASLAVCGRLGMTPLGITDRWYGMACAGFRLDPPGSATGSAPRSAPGSAAGEHASGTMVG